MNPEQPQTPPNPVPSQVPEAPNPPAPATPGSNNPYDFIVNPAPVPKKSLLTSSNGPMKLLVLIGFVAGAIILVAVVFTLIFSKSSTTPTLTTIVQEQQELIRIATQGEAKASDEATKAYAYNVDLSISTNQQQLLSYLSKHGTTVKEKELALKKDPATDKLLTNAQATSTYDSTLKKVLATQLQTYLTDIQTAFKETSNADLKTILNKSFTAGKTLLTQDPNATQAN
ncbi:hypothetical protein KDA14_04610 [Candidatus Saccharibacteria bacterium]|nr:hypothetical protein [Candidatus Saccharibacteria bacterium]